MSLASQAGHCARVRPVFLPGTHSARVLVCSQPRQAPGCQEGHQGLSREPLTQARAWSRSPWTRREGGAGRGTFPALGPQCDFAPELQCRSLGRSLPLCSVSALPQWHLSSSRGRDAGVGCDRLPRAGPRMAVSLWLRALCMRLSSLYRLLMMVSQVTINDNVHAS